MIVDEQEHHALCYRAISMIDPYAQMIPSFYQDKMTEFTVQEKESLSRWIEWVKTTLISASNEATRDYQRTKRRTVIVLADIVEAAMEITLASCLDHLDPVGIDLKSLTGYKKRSDATGDLKQAIRSWERKLFPRLPTRSSRFIYMIQCFFPSFAPPKNSELIDILIVSRNSFTHDLIPLSSHIQLDVADPTFTDDQIDGLFAAASDFLLAFLTSIPGDLPNAVSALNAQYTSKQHNRTA